MIQFLSRLFSMRIIQNSKGVSIIGVLVASSMGLIVIMGLSSMLSNMNTAITQLKKDTNQNTLVSQINNLLLKDCKKSLTNSIDLQDLINGGAGTGNTQPIEFSSLKDGSGTTGKEIFNTKNNPDSETDATEKAKIEKNRKKLKNLYDLVGHTKLHLKCAERLTSTTNHLFEPKQLKINIIAKINRFFDSLQAWASSTSEEQPSDCDCSSGPYPCQRDWSLSLFTMSYKNNLPVYRYILNQGLKITYKSSSSSDFTCHFGTLFPSVTAPCPSSNVAKKNHFCKTTVDPSSIAGSESTIFGVSAGSTIVWTDSLYGYKAGSGSIHNTQAFFGASAGASNRSETNTFFGANAGQSNVGGINTSFGYNAGSGTDSVARQNTFFGANAGQVNSHGRENSFFGYNAGQGNTGQSNEKGSYNTFFGANAGNLNTEESHILNIANVIYGKIDRSADINFDTEPEKGIDVHGKIRKCNKQGTPLSCQEVQTSTSSSREYKKNIVLFEDYETALEALLQTPLFTYQHKQEYPRKKRMGVIAEELPLALQLPGKEGEPVKPDWPSIYGYLWAGIKALHKDLRDFRSLAFKELAFLKALFRTEVQSVGEELKQELQNTQEENQSLHKSFKEVKKETHRLNQEIKTYKKEEKALLKEIAKRKKQQKLFQKELNQIKQHYQNKK